MAAVKTFCTCSLARGVCGADLDSGSSQQQLGQLQQKQQQQQAVSGRSAAASVDTPQAFGRAERLQLSLAVMKSGLIDVMVETTDGVGIAMLDAYCQSMLLSQYPQVSSTQQSATATML